MGKPHGASLHDHHTRGNGLVNRTRLNPEAEHGAEGRGALHSHPLDSGQGGF